jgi:hypothetical protein
MINLGTWVALFTNPYWQDKVLIRSISAKKLIFVFQSKSEVFDWLKNK